MTRILFLSRSSSAREESHGEAGRLDNPLVGDGVDDEPSARPQDPLNLVEHRVEVRRAHVFDNINHERYIKRIALECENSRVHAMESAPLRFRFREVGCC
jgi:hypothetical protein